jgi:hypothetical protein
MVFRLLSDKYEAPTAVPISRLVHVPAALSVVASHLTGGALLAEALGTALALPAVDGAGAVLLGAAELLDDTAGTTLEGCVGGPDEAVTDAVWDGTLTALVVGPAVLTIDAITAGLELVAGAPGPVVLALGLGIEAVGVVCGWSPG